MPKITNEDIINYPTTIRLDPQDFLHRFSYGIDEKRIVSWDSDFLQEEPDYDWWILYDTNSIIFDSIVLHITRPGEFDDRFDRTYILKVSDIYLYDTKGVKIYMIFKYFNTRTKKIVTKRVILYNNKFLKNT